MGKQADMFDLGGKAALVAGGAGYLTLPVCLAFAEHGARVAIADGDEGRLRAAVGEVEAAAPGGVLGLPLEAADEGAIARAVARTLERFGRLDVLLSATYCSVGCAMEDLTAADFDRANRANVTGAFLLARAAAEAMREGGSIILYSSMYGLVAPDPAMYEAPMQPNPIEYNAGKGALVQMTRYLAAHYGRRNIRVNAIAPGPFPRADMQAGHPAFIERLARRTMLGRIGRRHETAGAALFLASDASSFVTGHVLCVDGGWTAW